LAAPGASAEDLLTPAGPATVRGQWIGPQTAEGRGPAVVVGWTVTVGPGGSAGPVRLQLAGGGDRATVSAASPAEALPAAAGTYTFAIPPGRGLRLPSGRFGSLAVAQEVGGHAILRSVPARPELGELGDPARLSLVDVFRPALADDARDVPYAERRSGQELAVAVTTERDADQDGLGDQTQDAGDLRIVTARIAEYRPDRALVVARVRNAGTTVRDAPALDVPGHGWFPCDAGSCARARPLAPGAEVEMSRWVDLRAGPPVRVQVGAEGPDATPADNVADLAPFLRLVGPSRAVARGGGLRMLVSTSRAGAVRLAVRAGGVDFGRTLRFPRAGRITAAIVPARAADRRLLAAALRRPGKLMAIVTAAQDGGTAALRVKL